MKERLQKLISGAGLASRRTAETWIAAGRVTVDGQVARPGDQADPDCQTVCLDGRPLERCAAPVYLLLHKPRGYVTTLSDEKGRRTVNELVADCGARVYPVGRLDLDSEGLLLMTNDGELANRLMHPRGEVNKTYLVWLSNAPAQIDSLLRRPMMLDGAALRPAAVRCIAWHDGIAELEMTIHEGKNRQIRRMCAQYGATVTRLRRIAEGPIRLGDLPKGKWRHLTGQEVAALQKLH